MDNNIEVPQEAPEILDKETQDILGELEAEGHTIVGREPKVEEPTPEAKPADPEPVKPEPEEKPVEAEKKSDREVKFIPAWQHKVAEKNWEKRQAELEAEIQSLKTRPTETPAQIASVDDEIKSLADEYNIDESLVDKLVKVAASKVQLPTDVIDGLKHELDSMKAEKQAQVEAKGFEQEFGENILPLVKAEYPEISEGQLEVIKNKLKEVAYTEQFAKTPLGVIYKGVDDFRGVETARRASAEAGRGGNKAQAGKDFDSVSEEDISKMSAEEFDRYSTYMATR